MQPRHAAVRTKPPAKPPEDPALRKDEQGPRFRFVASLEQGFDAGIEEGRRVYTGLPEGVRAWAYARFVIKLITNNKMRRAWQVIQALDPNFDHARGVVVEIEGFGGEQLRKVCRFVRRLSDTDADIERLVFPHLYGIAATLRKEELWKLLKGRDGPILDDYYCAQLSALYHGTSHR